MESESNGANEAKGNLGSAKERKGNKYGMHCKDLAWLAHRSIHPWYVYNVKREESALPNASVLVLPSFRI